MSRQDWLDDVRHFLDAPSGYDARRRALDELFTRMAVDRHAITEVQARECIAEAERLRRDGRGPFPGQLLLVRRLLSSEQYVALLDEVRRTARFCIVCDGVHAVAPESGSAPCPTCGAPLSAIIAPDVGDRPDVLSDRRLGKYTLLREVGRGGTGIVYEAEDPELKRHVALKVLKEDEATATEIARFQREAAIAAQLRHPNIIAIHDVGIARDRFGKTVDFIAMDFVDGCTLEAVIKEGRPTCELVASIEDVARAVGFAHSRGVIHRDLKPGNVLVTGHGHVVLTDFGLARAESFATRLTRTNAVMGTPQYMAPEQVEGDSDRLCARTDVYALGVMLYEALTGRPPVTGLTAMELFNAIKNVEPTPPRALNSSVDRDLEIICLKAMMKDPTHRYADAQAMADDLARARLGEAILARRPSLFYRWRKKLARRRALAFGAAVCVVALGCSVFSRYAAAREREEALAALRKRTRTTLDAALVLRRAGRLVDMRRFAVEAQEASEAVIRRMPKLAEPHYQLGRIYRALMIDDKAAGEQERALAKDPAFAPALYERVVLGARQHRQRVVDLWEETWYAQGARFPGRPPIPTSTSSVASDPLLCQIRKRLDSDLRRFEGIAVIEPGQRACAMGLLKWVHGDLDGSRKLLRAAVQEDPALEEAYEALATVELDAGRYEASVESWSEGVRADAGYLPHLEGRGTARLLWSVDATQTNAADPVALCNEAVADFGEVLQRDPERAEARRRRGVARVLLGFYQETLGGQEASSTFVEAIQDLDAVLNSDPRNYRTLMWRGVSGALTAWFAWQRGREGSNPVTAVPFLSRAVEAEPRRAETWMWRGVAEGLQASYLAMQGADPTESYEAGMRDLNEAIRLNPDRVDAWIWRGLAQAGWAYYLGLRLQDPTPSYEAARRDFDHSLDVDRDLHAVRLYRAMLHATWGAYLATFGKDPTSSYRASLDDCDRAITHRNLRQFVYAWRGHVRGLLATYFTRRKQHDDSLYDTAIADLSVAVELGPTNAHARQFRAMVYQQRAPHVPSPAVDLQAAIDDYRKVLELNPTWASRVQPAIERCRRDLEAARRRTPR